MELLVMAVHVGTPQVIGLSQSGKEVTSCFFKKPVTTATITVGVSGIEGDCHVYGGNDQAVYAFPAAHLAAIADGLGRPIVPGSLGENLTVSGGDESDVRIDDLFECGDVQLRVTKPRRPCRKLTIVLGDVAARLMFETAWCGWYFAVESAGVMPTNGLLVRTQTNSDAPTVAQVFRDRTRHKPVVASIAEDK